MVNAFHALAAMAAFTSTAVVAAPVEQDAVAVERRANCASGLYMIVARGTGEAAGEGKPSQVADLVAARVPGSISVAVDYPASAVKRDSNSRRELYPASVAAGIKDTKKKIEDYVAQCGAGSKIALIGYSQGGNVMTDLLAGGVLKPAPLDDKYYKNLVAVTVFGDPTFAPNQSYDHGSNANGSGGIFTRKNNADELAKLNAIANKLASYCDTNDIVCADGTSTAVHSAEVSTHAHEAADFIVARAH